MYVCVCVIVYTVEVCACVCSLECIVACRYVYVLVFINCFVQFWHVRVLVC